MTDYRRDSWSVGQGIIVIGCPRNAAAMRELLTSVW